MSDVQVSPREAANWVEEHRSALEAAKRGVLPARRPPEPRPRWSGGIPGSHGQEPVEPAVAVADADDEYSEAERQTRERLGELDRERPKLLLEAKRAEPPEKTAEVMERVAANEDETRVCHTALERIRLVREEMVREAAAERAEAASKARAAALELARGLGEERLAAAREVDAGARALASALAKHGAIVARQNVQLEAAGRKVSLEGYRMVQRAVEHALGKAFTDAGVWGGFELPPLKANEIRAFAEGDPAPRFAAVKDNEGLAA
jgi:hypothetical protein